MRVLWRLWTTLAVCLGLCMATGVHAQSQFQTHPVPGYPASYTADSAPASMVNWETNYSALEQRIWELERAAKEKEGAHTVSSAKTTQKWGGRVHFDYWPTGNGSPLANYLETTNAGNDPEDFIGFRRLRFGVGGDIGDTWNTRSRWNGPPRKIRRSRMPTWAGTSYRYFGRYSWAIRTALRIGSPEQQPLQRVHGTALRRRSVQCGCSSHRLVLLRRVEKRSMELALRRIHHSGSAEARFPTHRQLPDGDRRDVWRTRSGTTSRRTAAVTLTGRFPARPLIPTADLPLASRLAPKHAWTSDGSIPARWPERKTTNWSDWKASSTWVRSRSSASTWEPASTGSNGREDVDFGGGYVYVAYFLTGEHTPWERKSGTLGRTKPFENFFLVRRCDGGLGRGWGAWQVAARYSYGDFSDGRRHPRRRRRKLYARVELVVEL
jgi:phosphate-selective porin OprO and OprP